MSQKSKAVSGTGLKLFISAGEASGDRQGAALVDTLREFRSEIDLRAIGGSRLAHSGADIWLDSRGLAVMGLASALAKAPAAVPKLRRLKKRLIADPPDAAVLIDWGGVNMRIAAWLKELRVPTLYYLPPRSWDRRAPRDVAFLVDAVATQFPWSKHILSGGQARVEWVGHPLVDMVRPKITKAEAASTFGLDLHRPIVALLPGSRRAEIMHCLPPLIEAGQRVREALPHVQFLIPASEELSRIRPDLKAELDAKGWECEVLQGMDYDALQCADAAAAVSGTVTLEMALLGIPMTVIYRMGLSGWLQYSIANRSRFQTPFFSMPNIIADRAIVTELAQSQAEPHRISQELLSLVSDSERRENMKEELASICRQLGPVGAIRRTAEMILDLVAYGAPQVSLETVGATQDIQ